MAQLTYKEAIQAAVSEEMRRDARVFVMGQDIECLMWDAEARQEFGSARIRNTPISELATVGAGIGAALTGMRPIVEVSCSTFLYPAMDQIVNQAAKSRYMFGDQARIPLVIRASVVYGSSMAAHHSDRPWGLFAQVPGLKIIVPSTPYDVKGLLKAAIRDENPVLCFEDANLNSYRGEVPDGDYTIPIGSADIKYEGSDVTIVSFANAVHHSLAAARELADQGISAEVVDLRTVVPMDRRTIIESVVKTGRLVVVDSAPGTCSVAAEVAALAAEQAFHILMAPIIRVTAPDVPVPFSPDLERLIYPTPERIKTAVHACLHTKRMA